MANNFNTAPVFTGRRWHHAALCFLALSAAVNVELLEDKDEHGRHRFSRGRQKYYGIGSLVIFFAIFSGYGMGHMLATMSTISASGAIAAACVWAIFQWCLERQLLISIRADVVWWKKAVGISWRALLALLSASTMVYPFFVESNRAEIDVKIADMARTRLIDNRESAGQAVGMPSLRAEINLSETALQKNEIQLAGEPPDIAAFKQRAKRCWLNFQDEERRIRRDMLALQSSVAPSSKDILVAASIQGLQQKLDAAKVPCQVADQQVLNKILDWKQQRQQERKALQTAFDQLQNNFDLAKQKEQSLTQEMEKKISAAANSGFAADFSAVAELVQHDVNRRFQLIWWMVWFFTIEMVAILVKFTSTTDVDEKLRQEENQLVEALQFQATERREAQLSATLKMQMQSKGHQAAWLADDGNTAKQITEAQLVSDKQLALFVAMASAEMQMSVEVYRLALSNLEELCKLAQRNKGGMLQKDIEAMLQASMEKLNRTFEALLERNQTGRHQTANLKP